MTTASGAPLGRYGSEVTPDAPRVEVRLLATPLRLWQRAADHHDELLRELSLLALAPRTGTHDLPTRLVELVELLGKRYGAAVGRPDAERDSALARGLDRLDLVYRVPLSLADDAQSLAALMAECEQFCRSGELLTMPQPPDQAAFGQWYLGEFVGQLRGGSPTPWPGPWR